MNYTRKRNRQSNARRGIVAVEFALVLPFILLIFLGTIELANLNFIRNMANDSAYRVARAMIVPGAESRNAISQSTELMKKVGVKNATITLRETSDIVTVNVSIPIKENSWSVGTLAGRQTINQTCQLRKSFKSSD